MNISSSFTYSKHIVINVARLNELKDILSKSCDTFSIRATTVSGDSVVFSSFDELKRYDNFKKGRLKKLSINATMKNSFHAEIDMVFMSGAGLDSVYCNYCFDDSDRKAIFLSDIKDFLEKTKEANLIANIGDWISMAIIFSFCFIALDKFQLSTSYMSYIYGSVIPVFLYFIYSRLIWYKLFPVVSFMWGESEKYYRNIEKVRSGLFWSGIVGFAVGILVNFF